MNPLIFTNKFLIITSQLFVISFIMFLLYSNKNFNECVLAACLVFVYICSTLFWCNPIQHSQIHKIDAIVAKIAIIAFALYTFLYKGVYVSYCFLFLGMLVTAYLSHYYSDKQWCCENHILSHGLLHTNCFLASFYAFI